MKLAAVYFISIPIAVTIHEYIHYVFAKLFKMNPKLNFNWGTPSITYSNGNNDFHNLIIASSAPLVMIVLGLVIPNSVMFLCFKLMCFSNIFNVTPFTTNGEVILLSLINILRRKK